MGREARREANLSLSAITGRNRTGYATPRLAKRLYRRFNQDRNFSNRPVAVDIVLCKSSNFLSYTLCRERFEVNALCRDRFCDHLCDHVAVEREPAPFPSRLDSTCGRFCRQRRRTIPDQV